MHKVSALFTTQRDRNCGGKTNGVPSMAPRHHVASSPALFEHVANSNGKSPLGDGGLSLCTIFKLIAQKRICVVRRAGSDVDQQISSLIASAFRAVGRAPPSDGSSTAHFLSVDHHCAGKMLDRVGRRGLPLIFLNGDCVGGLAELKQMTRNGFLVESLCSHDFDLAVIGSGEGNAVAERAVEAALKLGKRVALVEVKQTNGRKGRSNALVNAQIAKQMANQAALMRHSIEEAQRNGWTVEYSGDGKINFGLDWQSVREAIEQETKQKREWTQKAFEKVQTFPTTACHFSGSHQLSFCHQLTDSDSAQNKLAKLSADKFLLVPKSEAKVLENVPGAKEFCISNDELFTLEHNPGTTLFFCDDEADPQILESAAILRALGNEVTVMTNTYSPSGRGKDTSKLECFDSEFILSIKDKLCQLGIRFFISLPTKFERLREPSEDKSAILRVYATKAWSKSAEKGAPGDWTPFVEEFNTVVISVGRRPHLTDGFVLDNLAFCTSKFPNSPSISDSINGTMNGTTSRRMSLSSELLQAPNVYGIGDLRMEHRWRGETTPQGQSEEGNCQRVRKLLRKMYEAEFETMDTADSPIVSRTMLIPPMEYSCCGMNEEETERKWGRHLTRVYRDGEVPIMAERAKMICVMKGTDQRKKELVVGLHIIGPKANQLISGYALAMKLGLTKCQMEQDNWHKTTAAFGK
ncbi:hypothetical protein niasHT_023196 [Heterodera trifolii]|uniref:Pyridine nucleotide-disulphide oxidoreductase dimerisation domain-containing protein n=1 Tax=Heterodera trifolii TaxID=157864 RepID=A0ABD2JD80_9BILA